MKPSPPVSVTTSMLLEMYRCLEYCRALEGFEGGRLRGCPPMSTSSLPRVKFNELEALASNCPLLVEEAAKKEMLN